jgi:ribose 1,5-bisphosphate isomerase
MHKNSRERIEKIKKDVQDIHIQGATNVAFATLEGMKIASDDDANTEEIIQTGKLLSNVRPNEPMARNAVKYIKEVLKRGDSIENAINEYGEMIRRAKLKIINTGVEVLSKYKVILTHCHSSTATAILIESSKKNPDIQVVSTETRPRYQGRITSKELYEAGVDVTLIADSASASFIVDDRYLPVEAVIIGCDELLKNGSVINKVGSYQMALAANHGNDEFYVATSLMKLDPERDTADPEIEMRKVSEIWDRAPKGLEIINPSFEVVPSNLVTGYITEAGLLKPKELSIRAEEKYPWL